MTPTISILWMIAGFFFAVLIDRKYPRDLKARLLIHAAVLLSLFILHLSIG